MKLLKRISLLLLFVGTIFAFVQCSRQPETAQPKQETAKKPRNNKSGMGIALYTLSAFDSSDPGKCTVKGSCGSLICSANVECGCDESPSCSCGWSCNCGCEAKEGRKSAPVRHIITVSSEQNQFAIDFGNFIQTFTTTEGRHLQGVFAEYRDAIIAQDYQEYLTTGREFNDTMTSLPELEKSQINAWFGQRGLDIRL